MAGLKWSPTLGWTAAAILLGLAAASVAPVAGTSTGFQYAAACSLLTITVVGGMWLDYKRTGDILSMLALVGLFYLLAFVAGSIWLWFELRSGVSQIVRFRFSDGALMRAEWLVLLSWIGFFGGYHLRAFRLFRIPRLQLQASTVKAQDRAFACLYLVGIGARLVGISRGLFFHNVTTITGVGTVAASSTVNQLVAILMQLPLISIAYLGIRTRTAKRLRPLYATGLTIEFLVALASGGRSNVIPVIVVVLGVPYYSRNRLPIKATVVAILVGVFVVFPLLSLYRGNNVTGYHISNLSTAVTSYGDNGFGGVLLSGVDTTLGRFDDIIAPAVVEDRGRHVYPLPSGGTLPLDFVNLVPHAVDPSKPVLDNFGNQINYAYGLSPLKYSYFAFTMLGEMYLDYGTVGVLVAFLVIGALYRLLNEWFAARTERPAVCALYLGLAYGLIQAQESFIGDQLFGILRAMLVFIVLIKGFTYAFAGPAHRPTSNRDYELRSGVLR